MKSEALTALQREALDHLEKARREGLSVSAYARAQGIPAHRIYDAVGRLRRRGVLPGHSIKGDKFIAVKIAAPQPSGNATVCRMLMPRGLIIECQQWPPHSWLESLSRAPDAST
jgi:hypothetical protein